MWWILQFEQEKLLFSGHIKKEMQNFQYFLLLFQIECINYSVFKRNIIQPFNTTISLENCKEDLWKSLLLLRHFINNGENENKAACPMKGKKLDSMSGNWFTERAGVESLIKH